MNPSVAILHYTAPPVVGGVEAVIQAHAQVMIEAGYPLNVVAGRGEQAALPAGARFVHLPLIDSQHPDVAPLSASLAEGRIPDGFDRMVDRVTDALAPALVDADAVIAHNVLTKHFNLPLTAALHRLLDSGAVRRCVAWSHDFTWTSPNSRSQVHPGYPWDLLRTTFPRTRYVVVSQRRQRTLAELFGCPPEQIRVVYNGVDPAVLLGLSAEGQALIDRLGLLQSDLILLMPVRVTQAKNIELAQRVVAALRARDCRAKLVVTGPPDPHDAASTSYFDALRALRSELGLADAVRFVYESGPDPDQGFEVGMDVVGDLFRASDVMFMPSHREGFGMPVLEAGLVGLPVVCSDVPAAAEIGGADVIRFDPTVDSTERVAERILDWAAHSPLHRLRRRVRQEYTWRAILERQIAPLLSPEGAE